MSSEKDLPAIPSKVFVLSNSTKKQKGSVGEYLACRFLKKKGFKILAKNWTCRWGELDIVAMDAHELVFVEVKYRENEAFSDVGEMIGFYKLNSLKRSSQQFLKKNFRYSNHLVKWRIDAILVQKTTTGFEFEHYFDLLSY